MYSAETSWGFRAKTDVMEYRDRLAQGHNSELCLDLVKKFFMKGNKRTVFALNSEKFATNSIA